MKQGFQMNEESPELLIPGYLSLMDTQREDIIARLTGISIDKLWERPIKDKWSVGEHLDHCRVLTRSFRKIFKLSWYAEFPIAAIRKNTTYTAGIDDVYERPGFPLNVGWIWPPRFNAGNPVSMEKLAGLMREEHRLVTDFYSSKEEKILGHIMLYDPVIGWLNLLQALSVGIYHDAHHFQAIQRLLSLAPEK